MVPLKEAPGVESLLPRTVRLQDKGVHCAGGDERRHGDPGRLSTQVQRHQRHSAVPVAAGTDNETQREVNKTKNNNNNNKTKT